MDGSTSLFSLSALSAAVQYLMCWTWTNVGILACLAAAVGESGREIVQTASGQPEEKSDYRRAVVRGFFTYLAAIAGYVIIQGGLNPKPPGATSPQEIDIQIWQGTYTRIAIAVSLAGFLAGYAPSYFRKWVEKATGQIGEGAKS